MPIQNFNLSRSENGQGHDYTLHLPRQSWWKKLISTLYKIVIFPVRLTQLLVGRLLTHLILNPFFRKQAQETLILTAHAKFSDPLFEDNVFIINVLTQKPIISQYIQNWFYLLNYKLSKSIFLSWLSNKSSHPLQTVNLLHLEKVKKEIKKQITENKRPLHDIHLRGIEKLDPKSRATLLQDLQNEHHYDFSKNTDFYQSFTLKTPFGSILDSMEVKPPTAAGTPIEERKFIIMCMPRSNNYEHWLKQCRIYANQLDVTVIAFNYRGTGESKGLIYRQDDMRQDAYAQAQRLLALGVKDKNIALMGECLGANIATHVAGMLNQQGCAVSLYNARSFRSLPAVLQHTFRPLKDEPMLHPKTWMKWVGFAFMKYMISPILYLARWDLSVENEFKAIPEKNRDYLVVRSSKKTNGGKYAHDDGVIPYRASIYALAKSFLETKEQQRKHKFCISQTHEKAQTAEGHTCQSQLLAQTFPSSGDAAPLDGRTYAFEFFRRIWPETSSTSLSQETNQAVI